MLSRRKGESIIIGDEIEITIVAVDGESIRIGINAPRDITVHRKEIYSAIQESNKEAVQKTLTSKIMEDILGEFKG